MESNAAELGGLTWTEVDAPYVVVPVGSCEQHGPHLPLHTDTIVAEALARDLVGRRDDCVRAPSIGVTASGEHHGFAGTLSIGTEVMARLVVELARSADWSAGVVFVNGHGGNAAAMRRAAAVLDHEQRRVLTWWPHLRGADPHAGHTETSLMLALAPAEVRIERAVAGPVPPPVEVVRRGVRPLSDTGVLGDPTTASAEEGDRLFGELAGRLADDVARWMAS